MVFKGAATLIVRLSRALISHPYKPPFSSRIHQIPQLNKNQQVHSKYPTRFYLFPSIYRSFATPINGQNLSNLTPFRMALNEIKRRLFFTAPSSSRFVFGLLGYSLVPQSTIDRLHLDETFNQIGSLLSKASIVDHFNEEHDNPDRATLDDYELGRMLGRGCNAAVYEARLRSSPANSSISDFEILSPSSSNTSLDDDAEKLSLPEVQSNSDIDSSSLASDILPAGQFNLAIKMLFNYGVQSNAEALEKAMEKELLPLRQAFSHPNLVRMYSCFVDSFPLLHEAREHYPMAVPARLSPDGYGRNKTLFIVMRRYDLTLNRYLELNQPDHHQRLLLFAQLLEALLYLNKHSIVHRDLKNDNLLVCSSTGELVLADFGCALYHPPDLKIPYQTDEICKGGNLALMAPEISTCQPGLKSFLDYSKSDLWASGALFYEFFSQSNPFFHGTFKQETYDEKNLPSMSPVVPAMIERLIHAVLRRNPDKRPSISLVCNSLHFYLWFQTSKPGELYQTYMWTALETLFQKHSLSRVEYNLKKLFFERQTSQSFDRAQTFLNQL